MNIHREGITNLSSSKITLLKYAEQRTIFVILIIFSLETFRESFCNFAKSLRFLIVQKCVKSYEILFLTFNKRHISKIYL